MPEPALQDLDSRLSQISRKRGSLTSTDGAFSVVVPTEIVFEMTVKEVADE